jgi:ribonuclease D
MPRTAFFVSPTGPPQWVRTPEALAQLVSHLRGVAALAIDSESDSLHHFPEKVCLVQLATPAGDTFLVDPLSLPDLGSLNGVLADRGTVKVLHGAVYDLASMRRDFACEFAGLFDTMVAAQFLGMPEVGLAALLRQVLGVESGESRQKDDWAARPLSPAQEHYAAEDVRHLILLRARLLEALQARGRESWVEEECLALEATPAAVRVFRPDDCFEIKGVRTLERRGLAVLQALFVAREAWAQAWGRPPFKVVGNDTLLRLAERRPTTLEDVSRVPGCTPTVLHRYGAGILEAVASGMAVLEATLPMLRRPKKPRVLPAVERRIAALLAWRSEAAPRLGLDPGLVLPRRLIERLADAAPADATALGVVEGIRRWRVGALGSEILAALRGAEAPPHSRRADGHAPRADGRGGGG